jgi:hypothetical protein
MFAEMPLDNRTVNIFAALLPLGRRFRPCQAPYYYAALDTT